MITNKKKGSVLFINKYIIDKDSYGKKELGLKCNLQYAVTILRYLTASWTVALRQALLIMKPTRRETVQTSAKLTQR